MTLHVGLLSSVLRQTFPHHDIFANETDGVWSAPLGIISKDTSMKMSMIKKNGHGPEDGS